MEIDFVTSNPIKLRIANAVLHKYGISAKLKKMVLDEIQSLDTQKVALDKAKQVMDSSKHLFIVSDDGFFITALGGFPGALLKHVIKNLNNEQFIKLMKGEKNRNATFVNVIVFGNPKSRTFKVFQTMTKGRISDMPKGSRAIGWGIERIFIPNGSDKTLALMNEREWQIFWEGYEKNLHYNKLGLWLQKQYLRTQS